MAKPIKVYEEGIDICTYHVGPPARNPCLLFEGHSNIYPYTLMDDLYKGKGVRTYRGLCLENAYIKVIVFPELGGHIYSAYDKIAGREMFFTNDVFKPGLILLRGAWCPFGMEFNFPCGHSVTTLSPVDSILRRNPDGSGSVFVSDVEHVSRMKWLVEIRVNPEEAGFRTIVRLMNGTEVARRYYFWSNAAVPATKELQFISPADQAKPSGGGGAHPFPVVGGVDKSWYRNHDHAVDLFTINSKEDYFGYYDHGRDFGAAHVAPWYKVQGKKFFTWGTGPDGLVWSEVLSDKAGPYIEIQSGPFPTQNDFGMLQPHTANVWEAMWYPVRETGGFDYANEYAALKFETESTGKRHTYRFRICANRNINGVRIRFRVHTGRDAYRTVYNKKRTIGVRRTFSDSFTVSGGKKRIECKLIDKKGVHILTYIHEAKKKRVSGNDHDVDPCAEYVPSLENLFQKGYSFERYNNLSRALETYREAVEQDPYFSLALTEMGKIHVYMGNPEEAEKNLKKALARDKENSDARYYYGVALKRIGMLDKAEAEFQKLSLDNRFTSLAYYKLGQVQMLKGNYIKASGLFESALRYNPDDIYTELMVAVSMRKRGRKRGPMKVLKGIQKKDPTNFMLRNELYLISKATKGVDARQAGRELDKALGEDPQACIECAVRYGNTGLIKEAISILKRYSAEDAASDPFAAYYLGYYLRISGRTREGNRLYRKASRMDQSYGFPFRYESLGVFEDVLSLYPEDCAARYYMGNLLCSRRRVDEALEQWKMCEKLGSRNSVVYRNIGLVYYRVKHQYKKAAVYYRKALKLDPADRELYWELDQVYAVMGWGSKRVKLLESRPPVISDDMKSNVRLADAHFNNGDFEQALDVLLRRDYYPWEGGYTFRRLYMWSCLYTCEDHIAQGDGIRAFAAAERAEMYPENIKIRPPKHVNRSIYCYFRGCAYECMGETGKARMEWKKGADEGRSVRWMPVSVFRIYRARCLKKLGKLKKARALFDSISDAAAQHEEHHPDDSFYTRGICAMETGKFDEAEKWFRRSLKTVRCNIRARRALEELKRVRSNKK